MQSRCMQAITGNGIETNDYKAFVRFWSPCCMQAITGNGIETSDTPELNRVDMAMSCMQAITGNGIETIRKEN